MNDNELRKYARIGAEIQLDAILSMFPDLAVKATNGHKPVARKTAAPTNGHTDSQKRSVISKAGRAAISKAMKSRWRRHRKAVKQLAGS